MLVLFNTTYMLCYLRNVEGYVKRTIEYRRYQKYLHEVRLKKISRYCGYPGIYEFCSGHYRSARSRRAGNLSQYLKRVANKKVRRSYVNVSKRGSYKNVYDYWWELV